MRHPATYDALVATARREWDRAHYVGIAKRRGGPVLELGVGTGRVLSSLLEAGVDAYGVDVDEKMVERARRRLGDIAADRISVADVLRGPRLGSFPLIVAPYNFLAHVPPPRLDQFIEWVERTTGSSGAFAFDFIVADHLAWSQPPYRWERRATLEVDELEVEYFAEGRFDPATRVLTIDEMRRPGSGERHESTLSLHQWPVSSLIDRFGARGWRLRGGLLDDRGQPFGTNSSVCVVELERDDAHG